MRSVSKLPSFQAAFFLLLKNIYLFGPTWFYLWHSGSFFYFTFLILAHGIFSFGTWNLVPQPGTDPRPPALGGQSLSHWTTREIPLLFLLLPQCGQVSLMQGPCWLLLYTLHSCLPSISAGAVAQFCGCWKLYIPGSPRRKEQLICST